MSAAFLQSLTGRGRLYVPKIFPPNTLFNDCLLKSSVPVRLADATCLYVLPFQKLCELSEDGLVTTGLPNPEDCLPYVFNHAERSLSEWKKKKVTALPVLFL